MGRRRWLSNCRFHTSIYSCLYRRRFIAAYIGGAFVYVLTTKRMMVRVDRTKFFVRKRSWFPSIDADDFYIYDLRYLNGARVYAGLLGYGNISVFETVGSDGQLRDGSTFETEPFFFRDRRYVKVFYRRLVRFQLAEGFCTVYFGIRDVGRLG